MDRWKLRVLCLALAALLFLLGATTVGASGPEGALRADGPLVIEIQVEESGDWALFLGGIDIGVTSENFDALADRFNLGLVAPVVDPAVIAVAMRNGIQHLALVKEGAQTTILANGEPLSALAIADSALAALAGEFAPEMLDLASWANQSDLSVLIHFPTTTAADQIAADLTSRLDEAGQETALNTIELAATVSPDGDLLSIAGLAPEMLWLQPLRFDTTLVSQLGIDQLHLQVDPTGLTLSADGEEWASLAWDPDALAQAAPVAYDLAALEYTSEQQQVVHLAASWLKDTQISANVHFSEEPQDQAPAIEMARPVVVEVAADGGVKIEGMETYGQLYEEVVQYAAAIETAAAVWDGQQGQLRLTASDEPLPYLEIEKEFVTTLGQVFLSPDISWEWVESVLNNSQFAVQVLSEGSSPPDLERLDYQADPTTALVSLVPKVTVAPNGIAVYGESLPIDLLNRMTGTDILGWASFYAGYYGTHLDSVAVKLGPDGLNVSLNGVEANLRWDGVLRARLLDLVIELTAEQLDLPQITSSDLTKSLVTFVTGLSNQAEIGIELELTEEPISPGFLQNISEKLFPGG